MANACPDCGAYGLYEETVDGAFRVLCLYCDYGKGDLPIRVEPEEKYPLCPNEWTTREGE
jgi:hypothetical protein